MTVEIYLFLLKLTNFEQFAERCFENWQFVAKGDILERQVFGISYWKFNFKDFFYDFFSRMRPLATNDC